MRLSFIFLDRVADVNNFDEVDELRLGRATTQNLYFRLITVPDLDEGNERYIPAAGAIAQVNFDHIDAGRTFMRAASNPFPNDLSIFVVQILTSDAIAIDSMTVKLTEGTNSRYLLPTGTLSQEVTNNKRFYC